MAAAGQKEESMQKLQVHYTYSMHIQCNVHVYAHVYTCIWLHLHPISTCIIDSHMACMEKVHYICEWVCV